MLKSRLRAYQNRVSNAGWRIQLIPHEDPSKPMKIETNWLVLTGMLVFFAGIAAAVFMRAPAYVGFSVAGFIVMLVGLFVKGKAKRRNWTTVKATCLDREIRRLRMPVTGSQTGGWTWAFRLICQFGLKGREYTVTPCYWLTFPSEESLDHFLAKTISNDGKCALHVNPRNLLEAEFEGQDVKDLLFS